MTASKNIKMEAAYRAMVDRFLGWKLPQDFGPDAGISFTPPPHLPDLYWPTGTNLFHAGQALEMFKHCVELPSAAAVRLAEKNLFDAQEAAKIIAKQAIAAEAERDALAAKLAELEGQAGAYWVPLYARPSPAEPVEMSPDFTDTARSALLWVLWHHQGGSSPVGQPIRYALGMGAHEPLGEHQVQEAKRWAALTKSESTDFRQARTAPAEPVNVDFGKRGENMFFKIDNQSFLLEYKPEEQDEFDFMKAMLLSAFSRITHGVKTESQPVNARLLEALKRAKSALVSFKLIPGEANRWEESDEEDLAAIDGAIAAAEAQQERLLQDMHDAGREIDRVMAEAAPKAPQVDFEAIARAIWNVRREEEDRCDMELEDMRRDHSVWEEASEVASILKDAGIEVAE